MAHIPETEVLARQIFTTSLDDLNNTGVDGTVFAGIDGDSLGVQVGARGLVPGLVHVQHVHGRVDEEGNPVDSVTPGPDADTDGDGFVELAEGAPLYGPILVPLTSPPGAGVPGFPTAPDGSIDFRQVYDLNDPATFADGIDRGQLGEDLGLREIVLHGGFDPEDAGAGTEGEIDGEDGYEPVLPVAAGELAPGVLVYTADLTTLNGSGVEGNATLLLDGDELTVRIEAMGLDAGLPHPQHIHGRFDDAGIPVDSVTPPPSADTDGDGFVELAEGAPFYGPVIVPLTSPPGAGLEGFPTAPDGTIAFEQVYDLSDSATFAADFEKFDVEGLSWREIVLHGDTVDGTAGAGTEGEIDGTAGYIPVLPVAAGEIEFVGVIDGNENLLPLLREKEAVAEGERDEVNPNRLTLDAEGDATVSFVSAEAAFDNVLGAYLIDEDGAIAETAILDFGDDGQASLADAFEGEAANQSFGLFIVADGGNRFPGLFDDADGFSFVDTKNDEAATIDDAPARIALVHDDTGTAINDGLWFADTGLNAKNQQHAIAGIDPTDGNLLLAFEDKNLRVADEDYNDLVVEVDNGSGADRLLTAEEVSGFFTGGGDVMG